MRIRRAAIRETLRQRAVRSKGRDERGSVLIIAIFVVTTIGLLSVATVSTTLHGTNQAAVVRKNVQSNAASEAGLDAELSTLKGDIASYNTNSSQQLQLDCPYGTQSVSTTDGATNAASQETYTLSYTTSMTQAGLSTGALTPCTGTIPEPGGVTPGVNFYVMVQAQGETTSTAFGTPQSVDAILQVNPGIPLADIPYPNYPGGCSSAPYPDGCGSQCPSEISIGPETYDPQTGGSMTVNLGPDCAPQAGTPYASPIFSIASYTAADNLENNSQYNYDQTLFDSATAGVGATSLTINLPDGYYQVDVTVGLDGSPLPGSWPTPLTTGYATPSDGSTPTLTISGWVWGDVGGLCSTTSGQNASLTVLQIA